MPLNVHRMIRIQAQTMANELFEIYARDNATYRALREAGDLTEKKARRIFVSRLAPKLYEDARQALVAVLAQPDIPEAIKDEIAEALINDNALRGNRLVAKDQAVVPKHLH